MPSYLSYWMYTEWDLNLLYRQNSWQASLHQDYDIFINKRYTDFFPSSYHVELQHYTGYMRSFWSHHSLQKPCIIFCRCMPVRFLFKTVSCILDFWSCIIVTSSSTLQNLMLFTRSVYFRKYFTIHKSDIGSDDAFFFTECANSYLLHTVWEALERCQK